MSLHEAYPANSVESNIGLNKLILKIPIKSNRDANHLFTFYVCKSLEETDISIDGEKKTPYIYFV